MQPINNTHTLSYITDHVNLEFIVFILQSDIYPNQGAWTTVRCNFCGNLNPSVDKFELRFVTASSGLGSTWNAVGIKKLKIWTCEY